MKELIRQKRPSLHRSNPERLLEQMKFQNPYLKSAFMKADMAEQEEAHKNYKRAIDLYKEAVELLIPIAEGLYLYYCIHSLTLRITE